MYKIMLNIQIMLFTLMLPQTWYLLLLNIHLVALPNLCANVMLMLVLISNRVILKILPHVRNQNSYAQLLISKI